MTAATTTQPRERSVQCQRCWRVTTWNPSAVCGDCESRILNGMLAKEHHGVVHCRTAT